MFNWIKEYLVSPTHKWWVNNIWEPSWTKLTTCLYGLPAVFVTIGQAVSKFANDSTIAGYLDKIGMPNWVPVGLSAIALIYYIAQGRED